MFRVAAVLALAAVASPAASAEWLELFNGKDLADWQHVGDGSMEVENGLIKTHGGMGLLYWTGGKISNARIRVVYRMEHHDDNSGVFVRIPLEPREQWMPVHYGYEIQIKNEPDPSHDADYHCTGTLYSMTRALARPGKPGPEWNSMEITLDGPRTIVYVNGVKVTDYTEGDPVRPRRFQAEPFRGRRPLEGWIGLQNHGIGDRDVVYFKEIALQPF